MGSHYAESRQWFVPSRTRIALKLCTSISEMGLSLFARSEATICGDYHSYKTRNICAIPYAWNNVPLPTTQIWRNYRGKCILLLCILFLPYNSYRTRNICAIPYAWNNVPLPTTQIRYYFYFIIHMKNEIFIKFHT